MSNKFFKLKGDTFVAIDWSNVYGWFDSLGWEIDPQKLYDYLDTYAEIFAKNFYFGEDKNNIKTEGFHDQIKSIGYNLVSKDVKWIPVYLEKSHFKKVVKKLFDTLDDVKNTNSEISNKLYEINKKVEKLPEIDSMNGNAILSLSKEKDLQEIYELINELDGILTKLNIDIGDLQHHLIQPVMRRKCDFDVEISRDVYNSLNRMKTFVLFSGDGDYAALVDDIIKKRRQVILIFGPGHKGKEYADIKNGLFVCSVNQLRGFLEK